MLANEAAVQAAVRLEAARKGILLFRNNSGCLSDERGRPVRFGLGNDSRQVNAVIKSSDLIGITPVLVQPHHVGTTLGVFTAYEVKATGWHLTPGDERAQAQKRFIDLILARGGRAGFITSVEEL